MKNAIEQNKGPRLATLDKLMETTIAMFMDPVPGRDTIRDWLDMAKVPRFKANPLAKRGGGPCYYDVSAVEKLLRGRMMPGKASSLN